MVSKQFVCNVLSITASLTLSGMVLASGVAASSKANQSNATDKKSWDWHVGIASTIVNGIYNDSKTHSIEYPYVGFDYKRLTVLGPSGWFRVLGSANKNISVGGTLLPDSFNPQKDSNDSQIQKLDNRKYSIGLGLQGSLLSTKYGLLTARFLKAFYGGDGGYYSSLSYLAMVSKQIDSVKLSVIPSVGVQYYSGKLADYYYGVSNAESIKTGFNSYAPGGGVQPYVSLGFLGVVKGRFDLYASIKGARLPDSVFNSPIIAKRYFYTTSIILSMGL